MNVLILSCGTRNKIVQYFRKAIIGEGIVVAADCSKLAPALYDADKYFIIPKISDQNYFEVVIRICQEEKISGVISLIDQELSILSSKTEELSKIGVHLIGSNFMLCELSLNKYSMYLWLKEHEYKCATSYIDKEDFFDAIKKNIINYPVIVKPICGSASINIIKAFNRETVELAYLNHNEIMIQQYLNGQEVGADVYIDLISGEVISIFTKLKISMRAGETDKAVSFKNADLFKFIEKFVLECGYRGQIDIDLFIINGEFYISEVNPRFGGGYPHAYGCGVNSMESILNNLKGYKNKSKIGEYKEGVFMLKYSEIYLLESVLQ